MASLGRPNSLRIVREAAPGLYLDAGELGEVLLPRRYIPAGAKPGEYIDIFLYRDSEDRLVATTETPRAAVGTFAGLEVVSLHPRAGAFLNWALPKDLLLPLREQVRPLRVGEKVVVFVTLDETSNRVIATMRLHRHLDKTPPSYAERQRVRLLIAGETPLGYRAVVENAHSGLLYKSDLGSPLRIGDEMTGYIRIVRPDGKIDLGLELPGHGRIAPLTQKILKLLETSNGRANLGDHSTPAEIRAAFGASKKTFKQALGSLLRQRKIRLTGNGIELVASRKSAGAAES